MRKDHRLMRKKPKAKLNGKSMSGSAFSHKAGLVAVEKLGGELSGVSQPDPFLSVWNSAIFIPSGTILTQLISNGLPAELLVSLTHQA